jgi:hypothetical protein
MTLESCNWGQGHRLPDCCVVPPELLGAWNQSGKDRGIFHFQDFQVQLELMIKYRCILLK